MAKGSGNYSESKSYLFKNSANLRDRVEGLIPQVISSNGISTKADLVKIKSGLFGMSKNQCLVVRGDKTFEIVISCMPVGNFLYVSLYLNLKTGLFALAAGKATENDVFAQQQRDGFFMAITDCCEQAFEQAGIKF